jgi:hypothetical protein
MKTYDSKAYQWLCERHPARVTAILARLPGLSLVSMVTDRDACGIDYSVVLEFDDSGAGPAGAEPDDRRTVWAKRVHFGAIDDYCAGGRAFVAAAREQHEIADEWWALARTAKETS